MEIRFMVKSALFCVITGLSGVVLYVFLLGLPEGNGPVFDEVANACKSDLRVIARSLLYSHFHVTEISKIDHSSLHSNLVKMKGGVAVFNTNTTPPVLVIVRNGIETRQRATGLEINGEIHTESISAYYEVGKISDYMGNILMIESDELGIVRLTSVGNDRVNGTEDDISIVINFKGGYIQTEKGEEHISDIEFLVERRLLNKFRSDEEF